MGINPELERRFKLNPLGTTVAVILTFLLIYFLQSSVGPFAGNNTSLIDCPISNSSYVGKCVVPRGILYHMQNLWTNSNWLLQIIWPLWGAFIVIGFLLDDQRTGRLRPITIRIAQRAGGRLARTRTGQAVTAGVKGGRTVIRREERELEQFEEEESAG